MRKRIQPFTYDKVHTKDWYTQWFHELATEHGLHLVKSIEDRRAVFEPTQVEAAVHELWPEKRVQELRQLGVIPLSARRMERLCRRITIRRYVFENKARSLTLTVKAADCNEFPCLGIDRWLGEEMTLPGGFVEVSARDQADLDLIMAAIASAKG